MSCRPSVAALFPIILKASIEMGAAQSQDGVGSADGPEHSRLFKTTVEDAQAPDVCKRVSNPPSQGAEPVLKCGYGSSDERSPDKTTDTGRDSADCGGVCN